MLLAAPQRQQIEAAGAAFLWVDGAGEEIGGTIFQCLVADLAVFHHGDDDQRHIGQAAFRAHPAGQFDAVHARHAVIGDDDVRRDLLHVLQRFQRIGEAVDDDAGLQRARQAFEQAACRAAVVDDQHARAAALTGVARRGARRQRGDDTQRLQGHFYLPRFD